MEYTIEKVKSNSSVCPVCGGSGRLAYHAVAGEKMPQYNYYKCEDCGTIYIQTDILDMMDCGHQLIEYKEEYWKMEHDSAIDRCYGANLARLAEAIYYCQIPIHKCLDIGAGGGYLLDALLGYLPTKEDAFWAIEKYPPKEEWRTKSPHYIIGKYSALREHQFECGICVEVVEHLTPKMLVEIFSEVAKASVPGSLYLLNFGFASYVADEGQEQYLDPFVRGHIMSYSVRGLQALLEPLKFQVLPIRGKSWCIAIEYREETDVRFGGEDITDRIWSALPENLALLEDPIMGSALKVLGLESVRAYL